MERRIKLTPAQIAGFERLARAKNMADATLQAYSEAILDGANIAAAAIKKIDGKNLVVEYEPKKRGK